MGTLRAIDILSLVMLFGQPRRVLSGGGCGMRLKGLPARPISWVEEAGWHRERSGLFEGAVMDLSGITPAMQPQAATSVAPVQQPPEYREVIQSVKALNAAEMFGQENELLFRMDRQARRMVIQVVNRQTQEVVSQVPPEYILRLAEDLRTPSV